MSSSFSDLAEPVPQPAGHAGTEEMASYAAGTLEPVAVWSVEAHLTACDQCRSALSVHVDAQRLARNRSVLLVRAALGDGGRVQRLLCRCGVPGHLLRLLGATPSLRRSWLLSVAGVLAVMTAEAAAVGHGWLPGWSGGPAGYPGPAVLAPFLLVAPLLVLAGVAVAFLPWLDPACQLAVAAPFSGFTLLLARAVSALAAALVPVVGAAFLLPGPGWLPVALLLPSLALCALALAAATVMDPRGAAVGAGALWTVAMLLLATSSGPLQLVHRNAQFVSGAVLCVAVAVLLTRRNRFDLGWTR
jgi:hypothetical protein